jgi:hypothetical protein
MLFIPVDAVNQIPGNEAILCVRWLIISGLMSRLKSFDSTYNVKQAECGLEEKRLLLIKLQLA